MLVPAYAALLAFGLVVSSCSQSGPAPRPSDPDTGPAPIVYDPSVPWVITAIDYHFHDAHPTPVLNPEQPLVFTNAGSNLHNLSIGEAGLDRDLEPGERFTFDLPALLPGPGEYLLVCSYHADRGMRGRIRVAAPS
jgi:hypothetical protein